MAGRVFESIDLLREIFQYLEVHSKRQLLAVALTCRSFSEPAQDCLWRTMSSIVPFLRLLPSFRTLNGVQAILDNKPLSAYPRFQAHAVRVQQFLFADADGWKNQAIPSMIVLRLTQLKGDGPVFPALRCLGYASGRVVKEDVVLLLESPIAKLHISDFGPRDTHLPPILCMLPSLEKSLTWLYLSGHVPLNADILKSVASLSMLRYLHISTPKQTRLFSSLNSLQNIESLSLVSSEDFIMDLLLRLPSRKLSSLALARRERTPLQGTSTWNKPQPQIGQSIMGGFWHQCADVSREKWKNTLQSLSIADIQAPHPFDIFQFTSFMESIYPISNLEEIELKNLSAAAVLITDDDYRNIVSSWPRLRSLHLHLPYINTAPLAFPAAGAVVEPTRPTTNSLFILANGSPYLQDLSIYLPSVKFNIPDLPFGFSGNSSLKQLWLGNCQVEDPVSVATYLNILFPGLTGVKGVVPTQGSSSAVLNAGSACGFEWMAVQTWLQAIKSIRLSERTRIMSILDQEAIFVSGRAQRKVYI